MWQQKTTHKILFEDSTATFLRYVVRMEAHVYFFRLAATGFQSYLKASGPRDHEMKLWKFHNTLVLKCSYQDSNQVRLATCWLENKIHQLVFLLTFRYQLNILPKSQEKKCNQFLKAVYSSFILNIPLVCLSSRNKFKQSYIKNSRLVGEVDVQPHHLGSSPHGCEFGFLL